MSTAIRGIDVTARERLIPPPGNCVDGPEAVVFKRLDEGDPNHDDIELGKAACGNCLHLAVCSENRHEVAVQIAKLTNSNVAFVGGEEVESRLDDIRPRVIDAVVPFSYKELPEDPKLALAFLRRGVRSGVLNPGPRIHPAVTMLTDMFLGRLYTTNRKLHAELTTSKALTEKRVHKGIQDITAVMFQHADYDKVVAGKRSELRYRPERVQTDVHSEIATAFCRDMLALADRKFRKPERQSLYYSPDEYRRLESQYADEINPTDMHHIFITNIRDPETEFRMRLARLRILQEAHHGTGMPISALQERARWKLTGDPTEGVVRKSAPAHLGVRAAKAIIEGAEIQDDVAALDDTVHTIKAMHEAFNGDPTFTPSVILRFSRLPADEAIRRGRQLQEQMATALQDRDSQPIHRQVSDSRLRNQVLVSGYTDYDTLYKSCRVRTAAARFSQRKIYGTDGAFCATPTWALEQVGEVYDDYQFTGAVERLYELYSIDGLVTTGISELTLLQDLNYNIQLKRICHSRNGQYVAFAPGLDQLDPLERLAMASYYGMDELMYGQKIRAEDLVPLLETDDFDEYVRSHIVPRAMELKDRDHGMPVTMLRLSKDLDVIKGTELDYRVVSDQSVITIIGKTVMQLGSEGIDLGDNMQLSSSASRWLKRTIYKRCGGQYHEMLRDITSAISGDILVIAPVGDEYRIDFHPKLHEHADEQTIAALAHTLGIDTFMYGCNLKEILDARLETTIGAAAQQLAPVVREIQSAPKPVEAAEVVAEEAVIDIKPTASQPEDDPVPEASPPEPTVEPEPAPAPLPQPVAPLPVQQPKTAPSTPHHRVTPKHPTVWLAGATHDLNITYSDQQTANAILLTGAFTQTKDDGGRTVYLVEEDVRARVPVAVLINQARNAGIYENLSPATRRALEEDEKIIHTIRHTFPGALRTIGLIASEKFTSGQRNRFNTLLAYHVGHSKTYPGDQSAGDAQLFERGIQQVLQTFQTYRATRKGGFAGIRHRTQQPLTLALINDLLHPDAKQRRSMQAAIRALPASISPAARRTAHEDCLAELTNFGRWAAFFLHGDPDRR